MLEYYESLNSTYRPVSGNSLCVPRGSLLLLQKDSFLKATTFTTNINDFDKTKKVEIQ